MIEMIRFLDSRESKERSCQTIDNARQIDKLLSEVNESQNLQEVAF